MPKVSQRQPATKEQPAKTMHRSGAFQTPQARRKYWIILGIASVLAVGFAFGLLAYKNPIPIDDPRFWIIAKRRAVAVTAMAIVAVGQGFATVAFQTVTNNRIITPSIMGFESLYTLIHTSTVFFFGVAGLTAGYSLGNFTLQLVIMVGLCLVLYGWLLTGKHANIHVMLLVGIVIGGGGAGLVGDVHAAAADSQRVRCAHGPLVRLGE